MHRSGTRYLRTAGPRLPSAVAKSRPDRIASGPTNVLTVSISRSRYDDAHPDDPVIMATLAKASPRNMVVHSLGVIAPCDESLPSPLCYSSYRTASDLDVPCDREGEAGRRRPGR